MGGDSSPRPSTVTGSLIDSDAATSPERWTTDLSPADFLAAIEAEARADLLARLRADVEDARRRRSAELHDVGSVWAAVLAILDRAAQP